MGYNQQFYGHGFRQGQSQYNNNYGKYRHRNDLDIQQVIEQVKNNSEALRFTNYDISDLDLRILACEIKQNLIEQRDRSYSVRFTNYVIPPEIDNAREACFDVYKRFVRPALARAHADNPEMVSYIPSFLEVCDAGHEVPVRRRTDDKPFPFLFKFRSRMLVELFMDFADEAILDKNPSEDAVTVKGDLTAIHRDCMTSLKQDQTVEKFWMAGQSIKYTQHNSERVHVVTNPLGNTLQEMTARPNPRNKRVRCNRGQRKHENNKNNNRYRGFSKHQEFVDYDNGPAPNTYAAMTARRMHNGPHRQRHNSGGGGSSRSSGDSGRSSGGGSTGAASSSGGSNQQIDRQRELAKNYVRGGALMRKVPKAPTTSQQQSAAANQQPADQQLPPNAAETEKRNTRSTSAENTQ